jgi:hypothetical protein
MNSRNFEILINLYMNYTFFFSKRHIEDDIKRNYEQKWKLDKNEYLRFYG